METELSTLLEHAAKKISPIRIFSMNFGSGGRSKAEKHLSMRINMARVPFRNTVQSFDFKFQSSIDPKIIRELPTCRYVSGGENVLLLDLRESATPTWRWGLKLVRRE